MLKDLIRPVVNLNGSSQEHLLHQRIDILTHLRAARDAMGLGSPHPRDWQTSTQNAYHRSRAVHDLRMLEITELIELYEKEAEILVAEEETFHGQPVKPIWIHAAKDAEYITGGNFVREDNDNTFHLYRHFKVIQVLDKEAFEKWKIENQSQASLIRFS